MVEEMDFNVDKNSTNIESKQMYDAFSTNGNQIENSSKDPESGKPCQLKEGADFEEAILACGFGKFNILLLLCALPGYMTAVYVTSVLSFIMTSAECDLKMSMTDMGTLNSIPYSGMLTSAMLWGYLSDTLGRKKMMVWGFSALAVCELIASFSQTYWMLLFFEFLAGFIFNGPFAVMMSYISELHASTIRSKVLVYVNSYCAIGNIILPLIAWGIIPNEWSITLFGSYKLHSWHIFLALFSIPPLASGLAMTTLPESPKFLMSRGRNEEALKVFKKIYALNTGKDPESYPIKSLETSMSNGGEAPRGWAAIQGGFQQLKPLCLPPAIYSLFLVCFINAGNMLGSNTLRLWFPQIAAIIENYSSKHIETASLCQIISTHISNKTVIPVDIDEMISDCIILDPADSTYTNSIIIGGGSLIMYFIGGFLIDVFGKRKLTALGLVSSGSCALALYWSTSYVEVVTIFTIFVSISSFTATLLSAIAVDLFSTSTRVMAIAIFLMMGRTGTVIGGLTFPVLLNSGCLTPFLFISSIMLFGGIMSLVLPGTTGKRSN
ncbi:synaptic vesicle glycoprotein 2A-like [Arctopsyche grandis]|uniref:synaptic vesicle glycoprotein 2A-like n=1 Tax=Arctopsyche grandis TaxID=121162 RepID=UPI00406D9ED4